MSFAARLLNSAAGVVVATLVITTATLPTPTYGGSYNQTVATTGGTAPITFLIYLGSLPSGLSLNTSTGVISGTDGAGGAYNFTVKATSADGQTATQAYSGTILFGPVPGTVLLNDSTAGAGKTFTLPGGNQYTRVDVIVISKGGSGNGTSGGKGGAVDYGGSGASTAVYLNLPVTPGSSGATYTLPSTSGVAATCTLAGASLNAPGGIDATGSASGAAPSIATGGTTNYAGHAGGLIDTWDGGGAANSSGSYTDNTTDGTAGTLAGQGGAGNYTVPSAGGPATLQIIARA